MQQIRRSRIAQLSTAFFLLVFFTLVAYILAPLLLRQHPVGAIWFNLHIVGGSLVLALAPFQFVAGIRNRFRRYHRVAGYTYLVASMMAIVGFLGLPKNELFLLSQSVVMLLWISSTVLAIWMARKRNFLAHQHNMTRSFVFAGYFLAARLFDKHGMWLLVPFAESNNVRLVHSDWLAWMVPLIFVEIYFSFRLHSRNSLIKRGNAGES